MFRLRSVEEVSLVPHHWRSESAAALQERTLSVDSPAGLRKVELADDLTDAFDAIFLNIMLLVESQRIPDQGSQPAPCSFSFEGSFDRIEPRAVGTIGLGGTETDSSFSLPISPSTEETLDRLFAAQVALSQNQAQEDSQSETLPVAKSADEGDFEKTMGNAADAHVDNVDHTVNHTVGKHTVDSLKSQTAFPDTELSIPVEPQPESQSEELRTQQAPEPDHQAIIARDDELTSGLERLDSPVEKDHFHESDDIQEMSNTDVATVIAGGQVLLNSSHLSDDNTHSPLSDMESGVEEGLSSISTLSSPSVAVAVEAPVHGAPTTQQLHSGRIEQIAELTSRHAMVTNEAGRQRFLMKLDPGDLGELVIDIQRRSDGKFEVRLSAASLETRARLQEQTGEMMQSFTRQGMDLAEYEVGSTESHDFSDHSGQQEERQQRPEPILESRAFLRASTRHESDETGINFRA